ncbi:MAG: electron transport complex subunit RsxC [Halioglobus sp.]
MRKVFDFHGGIHPPENKHQSLSDVIQSAGIPQELTLPLSQHIGAPAAPLVVVGEQVLKGQMIAEAKGFVSVPVHAPTSGLITAIEERQIAHPSGLSAPCIVMSSDGLDSWIELHGHEDYENLKKSEILNLIRNAGIAGMGGAGFPTAVKLAIKPDVHIETLIINGTECEPYITADDVLMRERARQIIAGAKILSHLIGSAETLIGVEDNKPEGVASLREAAKDSGIEIVQFPTKYPSGGEKQLIEILTGKQVPNGGLPSDVGIVCQNIGTCVAIYQAIVHGIPLISRITTVTGEAISQPRNFEVLLGSPMSYLLSVAGYQAKGNSRLIMGGPMMGFTVPDADVPIVKTTNCILAPKEEELPTPPPAQACIRCGMCAEVCPASLLPQQLFWFAQGKEHEKLEQHNLFDCIECGACSWVCPSTIPLVQYYRASKAEILLARTEHEKAELSRQRFEHRQERLDREDREKEEKRAARKLAAQQRAQKAATGSSDTEDPIQAAIDRAKAKKAAQQSAGDAGSSVDQFEKLKSAVNTTKKRLATATEKLTVARSENSDLVSALQTGVDKTTSKLQAAEKALADYVASKPEQPGDQTAQEGLDPAQAAIQKALAARAVESTLTPEQKTRKDLEKLQQRLTKTQTKLTQCQESGEEEKILDALSSTIERLREKIVAAEKTLTETQES